MAPIANSRKRMRSASNESSYETQTKYFINEQIVNSNNTDKMKEIHDKTMKMLFQNANVKSMSSDNPNNNEPLTVATATTKLEQFRQNICLMGNGQINYIANDAAAVVADAVKTTATEDSQASTRKCHFCSKSSSIQATDCINCNLEICEFCGISCIQCNGPLCMTCVQLFGCCDNTIDMNACCERCKLIYNI